MSTILNDTSVGPATGSGGNLPYQPIFGICRIQLRSGKYFEGVVMVALRGDNDYTWDPNGFCQSVDGNGERVSLFDENFDTFTPETGLVAETLQPAPWAHRYINTYSTTAYFLQNMHGDHRPCSGQPAADDSGIYVYDEIPFRHSFLLLDYVPVYRIVPPDLYPSNSWHAQSQVRIPIADVAQFHLLTRPSPKWLYRIAVAESAFITNYTGRMDMVYKPGWYHKVVRHPVLRTKFNSW